MSVSAFLHDNFRDARTSLQDGDDRYSTPPEVKTVHLLRSIAHSNLVIAECALLREMREARQ